MQSAIERQAGIADSVGLSHVREPSWGQTKMRQLGEPYYVSIDNFQAY